MTDGNTGFQVAPITEDEMSKVHDILTRAINAVVGMSQLSRDVESMRNDMAQMSDEMDRLRRTNNALEESLDGSRRRRQELEDRLNDATVRAQQAEDGLATASRDSDHWQKSANGLLDQIAQVKRERDDAEYRQLELEDKLKTATATLGQIKSSLGITEAPAPVAVQVPTVDVPLGPPLEPTPTSPAPPPTLSVVEAAQSPTKTYISGYQSGAFWDPDKNQYYLES